MATRYVVVGATSCGECLAARRPWKRSERPGMLFAGTVYACDHGVQALARSVLQDEPPALLVPDFGGFFVAAG